MVRQWHAIAQRNNIIKNRIIQMTDKQPFSQKEQTITNKVKELDKQVERFTKLAQRSIYIGLGVLLLALVLFFVPNSEDTTIIALNKMEEFAKFLGSIVAAIWTLSGLFFVYVAFLGQMQSIQNQQLELFYNRKELKATKEELKGQKEQMIEQNNTLKQQRFENTFFQLFNYHQKQKENLRDIQSTNVHQGIPSLNSYYNFFLQFYKGQGYSQKNLVIESFSKTLRRYNYSLPFYISNIEQLLLLIDTQYPKEAGSDKKEYYIQLIKGTTSFYGKLLLLYSTQISEYSQLKELFIKYSFFENIDIFKNHLAFPEDKDFFINDKLLTNN